MNICFVYEYYYPHVGGGELHIQRLAEGLAARGHQVSVITSLLKGTQRKEKVNGVHIHRVPVPRPADRYWFTFLSYPAISRLAAEADIIQVATYNGAIAAWLAGRRHGKPVILLPFEVLRDLWLKVGLNPVSALGYMLFEKVILALPFQGYSCNSRYTMNSLLKSRHITPEKAFVAHPGIDYHLFDPDNTGGRDEIRQRLGVDENTFLVTYTGRPGVVKGVDYLIKAVPEIRRRVPSARILLLLARNPAGKYKKATKMIFKLDPKGIILHDQVSRRELPKYFQASDCIVVPSLNEGFGLTCVEACAMRKPVVVSNAGSLPEVVSGRYVFIKPGSAGAIAEGVEKIYRGEHENSEWKRFTWDECIDKHLEIYKQLAGARAGSREAPS